MRKRGLLRSQIIRAWKKSISTDYQAKLINSERALQASLWASLVKQLKPNCKNRRVFIEPSLFVDGRKIVPDLVVCNSVSVIAVIELKYVPRGSPNYDKDIRNMARLAEHREAAVMRNGRFRGVASRIKSYPFARHVLFVWAGVHAKSKSLPDCLYSDNFPALVSCFMELHAETIAGQPPEVFHRP